MRHVLGELERLKSRTRAMLVVQRMSLVLAWALGVAMALILLDYGLRLPSAFRLVLLVAGVAVLAWGVVRYLAAAFGYHPSLTQLALRVERALPSMSGRLASSVEFVASGTDHENPLAARSVREAERRLAGESMKGIIAPGRMLRGLGILLAIAAIAATLAVVYPAQAQRGVSRLLLPYGAVEWPARTAVSSLMGDVLERQNVHPRGQALALRARNETAGAESDRVDVRYRMMRDGAFEDWQLFVLTHQGAGIHERLVDTNAEQIELYFETEDARTAVQRIELVPPPAIVRATLQVTPPEYARRRVAPVEADLGPGLDDRSVTDTPALHGSRAELVFELSKPIPSPDDPGATLSDAERAKWIEETFGWTDDQPREDAPAPEFSADATDPRSWRLTWSVQGPRSLSLTLVDSYGLTNDEPIQYRINAIADQPPDIIITEPPRDDTVLPTAVIAVAAEAKDDVAVLRISLAAQAKRKDVETLEDLPFAPEETVDRASARIEADLDLAKLGLSEGDVVLLTAIAEDDLVGGATGRLPVVSPVRRLRILSEIDFVAQLRRQLSAVRQNAIRVESLQTELQDDVIDSGLQPGLERAQGQVSDRIAAQRDAVDELQRQVDQNRLEDEQLAELLQQSRDLLEYAGRAANRAVEAVEQRARNAGKASSKPRSDASARPVAKPGANPGAKAEAKPGSDPGSEPGSQSGADADAKSGQAGDEKQAPEQGDAAKGRTPDDENAPRDGEPDAAGEGDEDPASDAGLSRRAAPEDQPVADAQQEVREELADLIELLDRDEDTWVVQRQLESIIGDQGTLEGETAQLAQETIGQPLESLTPAQETELDRITRRQRELRDQARRLIEEMRRRAAALEEIDPQAASGMRTAADTGERLEVDRDMENAADRAEQNQLQSAGGAQQAAGQKLSRMLEDLQETKRARAEELLRQLASLIESIDRLIGFQENELIALAKAVARDDFSGRDRSMIRLNQNTQSVGAEARAAGQQSRRIARALDRAADAQGAAVTALRARPADPAGARDAEDRSLSLLKEARELAAELEEKTEQEQLEQQREKLIEAYRALAERQIVIREETLELAQPEPLSRRQLVDARRIGSDQQAIRTSLTDLETQTQELVESEVFTYVHRLIDRWSESVSDALWDGRVDIDVTDRQQMIAESIARQIEALEEALIPPDEFADDQQASQNQGGSGPPSPPPLIPPVAEVKRLHGLQEQVYNQTQQLDRRTDLVPAQSRQRLRELGEMQREIMRLGEAMLETLQGGGAPASPEPDSIDVPDPDAPMPPMPPMPPTPPTQDESR